MKIKIGEKVYLQKYDVAYITHCLDGFPGPIVQELFGDGEMFFMNGMEDGFRFDCIFSDPRNAKWLMEQDWIVDYDEYIKMPIDEFEGLIQRLAVEHDLEIDEFNNKDEEYRKEHFKEEHERFKKDSHKISSLDNLFQARKGKVKFVCPEEYQGKTTPDSCEDKIRDAVHKKARAAQVDGRADESNTSRKKLGFFGRLFGRGAR